MAHLIHKSRRRRRFVAGGAPAADVNIEARSGVNTTILTRDGSTLTART